MNYNQYCSANLVNVLVTLYFFEMIVPVATKTLRLVLKQNKTEESTISWYKHWL